MGGAGTACSSREASLRYSYPCFRSPLMIPKTNTRSSSARATGVRYILEVNQHLRPEALQALLVHDIGPETKDIIVTAGQELIEQGRKQGIEQGFQEVLLRQLRQRFGSQVDAHVEQRIVTASAEQVEIWSMRVLSAATLAELFAN